MKTKTMILAAAVMLISAPAFAGGKSNSLNVNLAVNSGKGGLVGTLLGAGKSGNLGTVVNANVTAPKNGVLSLLLGKSKSGNGNGNGGGGCGDC